MAAMVVDNAKLFERDNWSDISKRILGFSTGYEDVQDIGLESSVGPIRKARIDRDRLNHRVIEKKRRDRMNNCLADLSRLIPSVYTREGQGRIEKTEVIEMAIKHIVHLQKKNDDLQTQVSKQAARPPVAQPQLQCSQMAGSQGLNVDVKPDAGECFLLGYKCCQELVTSLLVSEHAINLQTGYQAVHEMTTNLVNGMQIKAQSIAMSYSSQGEQGKNTIAHAHALPLKPNDLRPRAHSLSLNGEDWRLCTQGQAAHQGKSSTQTPQPTRQRYASVSCGSTESGYSSDALAQSTGVSRMSPWTSGGTALAVTPPTAVTTPPATTSVARVDTPTSPGYKFKNDIHLRFKAAAEMQMDAGCSDVDATVDAVDQVKTAGADMSEVRGDCVEFKRKRAGFVLHREGRYYLPIQLCEELLPETVRRVEGRSAGRGQGVSCDATCHPISISVRLAE